MKKFSFKFEALLKLRKNQRDVSQKLLADVLRHDEELADRRRQTDAERLTQFDEIRELGGGGAGVNVSASSSRRLYAVQLTGRLGEIDARRSALARQIEICRQALVRADQAVKSLEMLAEKQQTEFVFEQERIEARALDETWQAIHAGEHHVC